MGRLDNLRPFNTLTPERRHEIAVKGGKARAEQRRQQRQQIEREKAAEIARREADAGEIYAIARAARDLKAAAILQLAIDRLHR